MLALAATFAVVTPALAGIDETYLKPAHKQSWGELLLDFVGHPGFGKSYALVVGISKFDDFSSLPTANDPLRMRDFLLNEAGFDYVQVLTDEKATKARIEELMVDVLPGMVHENDQFLFYWSGHGTQRPNALGGQLGYLPLAISPKGSYASMISMGDIQRWDEVLHAKQALFLLDACFSGLAGVASKSDLGELQIDQLDKPAHHLVSAGTAEEETIAGDRWGGSIFTDSVLRAVRGEADAETSYPRDGVVSLSELISYVKTRVAIEAPAVGWTRPITPQPYKLRPSDGEFFFLTNERKLAKLESGAEYQGHFEYGMPVVVMGAIQQAPAADLNASRDVIRFDFTKDSPIVNDFEDEMAVFEAGQFQRGTGEPELNLVEQEMSKSGAVFDSSFYSNSQPSGLVHIKGFLIEKHEVTWDEYEQFAKISDAFGEMPAWVQRYRRGGNYPVVGVTWEEADAFCRSKGKRLPSEAEWERAARGVEGRLFPWGNSLASLDDASLDDVVFCPECPSDTPKPGHPLPPGSSVQDTTPEGIRDLAGNVREWVSDWYASNFYASGHKNPENTAESEYRSVRGGSWYHGAALLVASARSANEPSRRDPTIGFRCAATNPAALAVTDPGRRPPQELAPRDTAN